MLTPNTALEKGQARLGLTGSYFSSSNNFNQEGEKVASQTFQVLGGGLFGHYGMSDEFTALAALSGANHRVDATTTTLTGTGLTDLEIGLRYQPKQIPVRLIFDASALFPLYSRLSPEKWASNRIDRDIPLGGGATELALQATFELPVSHTFYVGAGASYVNRSAGFSSLLNYSGYLKYEDPQNVFARFGVIGQSPITDDQYKSQALTTTVNERSTAAIGGANAFNTINPSHLKIDAALGIFFNKHILASIGFQLPMTGKNIAQGATFFAAIGYEWGATPKNSGYEHSNRGFQEYYLAAKVIQANNQLKQILVDKGKSEGIKVGELLDVFEPNQGEGTFGETVARGRVLEVGPTRTKIKLLEFFKETKIQEGFVVRRPVR